MGQSIMYSGTGESGDKFWEVCGVFVNPKNENEWCTEPYDKQQRLIKRVYDHIARHKHPLATEMELIAQRKSNLSKSEREMCAEIFYNLYGNQ